MAIRGLCLSAHYTPCVPVFRVKASSFVLPALSLARSVRREYARAHSHALNQIGRQRDTVWGVVQRQARVHSHRTWWFVRRWTCDRVKPRPFLAKEKDSGRSSLSLLSSSSSPSSLSSMRSSTGFCRRFSVKFSCLTRRYINNYMRTVRTTSSGKHENQKQSWVNRAKRGYVPLRTRVYSRADDWSTLEAVCIPRVLP